MNKKSILTDLDLRVLIALADNRGHPSWELEYIFLANQANLSPGKMKTAERAELLKTIMKIDEGLKEGNLAESRKEIDKSKLSKYMTKMDKGNLSKRVKRLESEGWIRRIPRKKIREQNERGPKTEEPLYITPDRYVYVNRILRNKFLSYKKQMNSIGFKKYKSLRINRTDGTFKDVIMHTSGEARKSQKYRYCESKYWHYVWLFMRWRARVRTLNFIDEDKN